MEPSALQPLDEDRSSDIFDGAFDWILEEEAFQRWRDGQGTWQLHCVGGPGSGKTTVTALLSKHLRNYFMTEGCPIITLHISEDLLDHRTNILEDFLVAVFQGLETSQIFRAKKALDRYHEYFEELESTQTEGCSRKKRLSLIRKAVHLALAGAEGLRAYLLLDGIDRCGATLRLILDSELAELQRLGMGILLTSRLAVFENEEATCEYSSLPLNLRKALDVYMQCEGCEETIICLPCARAGKTCHDCGDDCVLYEPYQHVNIKVAVSDERLANFIAWDLEREHGDLGLHSSARKPPLSRLGEHLLLNHASRPIQTVIDDIVEWSYNNISIAKARLDLVHEMESLESLDAKKDRLPTTVTSLFDFGLQHIEALPARQRDMALKSIAAAGRDVDGSEIPSLRSLLEFLGVQGVRSGEEIVEAARGWLHVSSVGDPPSLLVYNMNFLYYVQQRYHQGLHRSSVQINSHLQQRRGASHDADLDDRPNAVRFEPQNVSETPAKVTAYKLTRTVTAMPAIEEAPAQPFLVRKGTIAWD